MLSNGLAIDCHGDVGVGPGWRFSPPPPDAVAPLTPSAAPEPPPASSAIRRTASSGSARSPVATRPGSQPAPRSSLRVPPRQVRQRRPRRMPAATAAQLRRLQPIPPADDLAYPPQRDASELSRLAPTLARRVAAHLLPQPGHELGAAQHPAVMRLRPRGSRRLGRPLILENRTRTRQPAGVRLPGLPPASGRGTGGRDPDRTPDLVSPVFPVLSLFLTQETGWANESRQPDQ
jgi:hypothetical protein